MYLFSVKLFFVLLYCVFAESAHDNLWKKLPLEAISVNSKKNIVVSPLLVRFALCKLASFAQGTARNELLNVLGIDTDSMLTNCYTNFEKIITPLRDIDAIILNKIFVNYTSDIKETFLKDDANNSFGVQVEKVGYNYPKTAVSFINRWIDKASYKRIGDILELTDINNQTSILSISGASLKVTWEFPFDLRLTKYHKFHHHNGTVSMVPMMSRTDSFFYFDDKITNTQIVNNIKLAAFGLSVTLVIPRTSKALQDFLVTLSTNPDYLKGINNQLQVDVMTLKLPRFKIKTNMEWNKILQKIGVKQIFNETDSGLDAILKENVEKYNVYVSKVKQKNYIDVDEMGIFRQPVVKDLFPPDLNTMIRNPMSEIIADYPFYFSINLHTDRTNQWELFTGVYYGPDN